MAVIVDTRLLPIGDRVPVLLDTLTNFAPVRVKLEDTRRLNVSIQTWDLPDVPTLRYSSNAGLIMENEEVDDDRQFVVAVQTAGRGTVTQFGPESRFTAGQLVCIDRHRPFDFGWTGSGGSIGVHLSAAQLDLPPQLIRRAAAVVNSSPLAGLLANHLSFFSDRSLGDSASSAAAARTTVDLFRAVVLSVTTGELPSAFAEAWASRRSESARLEVSQEPQSRGMRLP